MAAHHCQERGDSQRCVQQQVDDGIAQYETVEARRPRVQQNRERIHGAVEIERERIKRAVNDQRDDQQQESGHGRLAKRRSRKISTNEMYRLTTPRPLTAPRKYVLVQYWRNPGTHPAKKLLSQYSVQGRMRRYRPI